MTGSVSDMREDSYPREEPRLTFEMKYLVQNSMRETVIVPDEKFMVPLFQSDRVDILEILLERDSCDIVNEFIDEDALIMAAEHGRTKMCEYIMEHDMALAWRNNSEGHTALSIAGENGHMATFIAIRRVMLGHISVATEAEIYTVTESLSKITANVAGDAQFFEELLLCYAPEHFTFRFDKENASGTTALFELARNNHGDLFRSAFLTQDYDATVKNEQGETYLLLAASNNNVPLMKLLFNYEAENVIDESSFAHGKASAKTAGRCPLTAVSDVTALRLLLEYGADVCTVDECGLFALDYVISLVEENPEDMIFIIDEFIHEIIEDECLFNLIEDVGANTDSLTDVSCKIHAIEQIFKTQHKNKIPLDQEYLLDAIFARNCDLVKMMIRLGFNINYQYIHSWVYLREYLEPSFRDWMPELSICHMSPLMLATMNGHDEMCNLLIEHGASPDLKSVSLGSPRDFSQWFER